MTRERFTVELAGTPIEIQCQYPQNRRFFRGYLSASAPVLTVRPTEGDALETRRRFARMYGDGAAADCPDWFWENQAVHWKLSEGLLSFGALLFHASALSFDGAAFLFAADSGTGKSTHAERWRRRFGERVFMIDDDKPYLKVTPEAVLAFGTPWNGKGRLGRNASAPVRAILELGRGGANRVEPSPDPFRTLYLHALRCAEPSLSLRVLELEREIVERVPFYRMECNLNPDAAEEILRGVERLERERRESL